MNQPSRPESIVREIKRQTRTADGTKVLDKTVAIAQAMRCTPTTAAIRLNLKKMMEILIKNLYIVEVYDSRKGQGCGKL